MLDPLSMSDQSEALKHRAMSFAVSILRLVDSIPSTVGGQVAVRQLARSATSIGANYRAACTARSRAEFIAKMCTVNEEADETVHWLELIGLSGYASDSALKPLTDEATELRAIFGTSLRTARLNERERQMDPRARDRKSVPVNDQIAKSMIK